MQLLNKQNLVWILLLEMQSFDIVFLDPPFQQNLLPVCFQWLEQQQLLSSSAIIYIETDKPLTELSLPKSLQFLREKKAGQVYYYLVERKQ